MSRSVGEIPRNELIKISLVNVEAVLPTEEINADFVDTLVAGMSVAGVWTHPLLLEESSHAILDGHHRFAAARRLGLKSVPAVRVSYGDPAIHLESWRPDTQFSPSEIIDRARRGDLLPYKSTRHVTDFTIPQVRLPLSFLRSGDSDGQSIAQAGQHPSRTMMLAAVYNRLCSKLRIRPDAAAGIEIETPETQAPHTQLRRNLQSDPCMGVLLSVAPGRLVLGRSEDSPFFLTRSGMLRLPPSLLGSPAALSLAARWGIEASHLQANGLLTPETLPGVVLHGMSLLRMASINTVDLLLDNVPPPIAEELLDRGVQGPSSVLIQWLQSRIEAFDAGSDAPVAAPVAPVELWNSVEELILSGGDSRLVVDDRSGFNRYGTVPRPRPEAVHFSSSTASSISDHGFVYCDILRRDLLSAMLREKVSAAELRARAVDAMAAELLELFALGRDEADAALAPSGTDTELLAVLVAATAGKPLTNVLIAPEETGRGVREAGAGQYFDGLSAAGEIIKKGAPAWPQMAVKTVEVAIRDDRGFARSGKAVFEDAACQVRDAVKQGHRVLLHVLASSKTGLSAPGEQETETLQQIAPDQIDVVVDACQLRTPFPMIGGWVRKGWMVQVSGSKFLTGPPFSGALLLPPRFRAQASGIKALLEQAPAVGGKEDWSRWWREEFAVAPSPEARSFGLIFRWLPALLEAQLFTSIPEDLRRYSFQRFRTALNERLDKSTWLVRVEAEEDVADRSRTANIATDSIVCFSVAVNHGQARRTLNEEECRLIFQLLNLDLSGKLGQLGPEENARAGLQAHIGQPVALKSQDQSSPIAILRMVLGARFFSIVAHAGPGSVEAALESEIADAIRALEKLELLASMWPRAKHILI